jgi:LPXTG-motif cell wall-anchored protein
MRAMLRRIAAITALVGTAAGTSATVAPTPALAATSRAVIVIGSSTSTISFNGTITGLQALEMVATPETVGYGQGTAVCKIGGIGNPAIPGECLGETTGKYWSYWRSPPGTNAWTYSGSGAGTSSVSDGSVEGWRYGTGQPPPYHSFCATAGCAPPPPPPTSPFGGGTSSGTDNATTTATKLDGTPADPDTGTTSTSSPRRNDDDASATGEQASDPPRGGRPEIEAGDDGSPVGIAVAGSLIAALGGAGLWFRRRRRALL